MKKAFTLVELIVVVTILAILGAIGFVSYNGYLSGVRDTNRTSQLTSLHDGLELYRTRKDLPDPDLKVEIKNGTEILGYQGYAGSGVLNTIEFVKGGKDPKDNGYFTYYLDSSKREFQLMSYLEDQENTTYLLGMLLPKVSAAVNYMSRYPVVYGKKLGILVDNTTNAPIQETLTGTLNLGSGTGASTTYKVYFKNDNVVTSSGTALVTKIKDNRTTVASSGSVNFGVGCSAIKRISKTDYAGIAGSANLTGGWGTNAEIQEAIRLLQAGTLICIKSTDNTWNGYGVEFTRSTDVSSTSNSNWGESTWYTVNLNTGNKITHTCTNSCFKKDNGTSPGTHNNSYAGIRFDKSGVDILYPGCGTGPIIDSNGNPTGGGNCYQNVDFYR